MRGIDFKDKDVSVKNFKDSDMGIRLYCVAVIVIRKYHK